MKSFWLVLFLLPSLLSAQNISCSLSATVRDATGAVVPNVKVTLTGEENGFVRSVFTTNEGFFAFPDLTPATFTIAIEAPGFKTYRQTGILVHAEERRSLGQIKLEVGQVSDAVSVTAEVVSVNTVNGERAGTLSGEQLDQIAMRGRDIFDAISLIPGVVDTSDGRDSPTPQSTNNIYILGGHNDAKNVTIDGVTNLDTGSNGGTHGMPSMDAVAEVKVLMSAYSAEYGRNPSSINIITKGGGKQFHGKVAWYFRNEDLNANNFFSNKAGQPRQVSRYNIPNYLISGPVLLPKTSRFKDRLFFLFSQEFQRQTIPYGVLEKTVPTPLERQGDFSKSYNTNGSPITVNDPLNGKKAFPGNIVPLSRINPVGQAILNIFPAPNFQDPNPAYRYNWNYYVAASEPYNRRADSLRLDYSPRDNWQLYVSLINNYDSQSIPYSAGAPGGGWTTGSLNFVLSPITYELPGRLGTLHSVNSISPTLFNEALFGASQNTGMFTPEFPDLVDRTKLGINIPQRNPSLNPLNLIPNMTFSGIQNYANPSMADYGMPYFYRNTIYSFVDNLSKIYRTHTFKLGIYFEHTQALRNAPGVPVRGSLSFNTDSNNSYDANNAYANALLGNYDSYSEATANPRSNYLFSNTEWFFQDDWKVTKKLSLSYGIRFYHDPPQFDKWQGIASFSPAAWNPASAPVLLQPAKVNGTNVALDPLTGTTYNYGLVQLFVPGVGNPANGMLIGGKNGVPPGLFSAAPVAVAPRFGFAWDPFGGGKTAIRGGGGIYYDRIEGNPTMNLAANPPSVSTPTSYFGTFPDIASSASSGYLAQTGTLFSLATVPHQQQVYNFNLSIDRRIGSNLFSVGYTGSLGRHLLWDRNINAVPAGALFLNLNPQNRNQVTNSALATPFLRPYSAYGDVNLYEFASNSNYHGLLSSVQHRLSHGINVSGSYTFSKALDCSDAYSKAVDPFFDPRSRNYGPAGYNRTHVFTTNFFYIVPKPGKATGIRPLGWLADNWELSGVVRMLTGAPLTPGYSLVNGITAPTGTPSATARMQVINPTAPLAQRFGPPPEPFGQATVPWTVPSTAPQFGNLGTNTMTGPGTNNWDISIYRRFAIRERLSGQLRLESYNTFNHTQFNAINSTAQFRNTDAAQVNPAFLLPTGARPPRRMQIALRLFF